jgi:hypothetical protein
VPAGPRHGQAAAIAERCNFLKKPEMPLCLWPSSQGLVPVRADGEVVGDGRIEGHAGERIGMKHSLAPVAGRSASIGPISRHYPVIGGRRARHETADISAKPARWCRLKPCSSDRDLEAPCCCGTVCFIF